MNLKRFYGTTDLRQIVRPTLTVLDALVPEINMERPLLQGYAYLRATRAGEDTSPARADRFPHTEPLRELLENTLQCRGETASVQQIGVKSGIQDFAGLRGDASLLELGLLRSRTWDEILPRFAIVSTTPTSAWPTFLLTLRPALYPQLDQRCKRVGDSRPQRE